MTSSTDGLSCHDGEHESISSLSELSASLISTTSENEGAHEEVVIGSSALNRLVSFMDMATIPRDDDGHWISIGAKHHAGNNCIPCKWFRSARGCKDGVLCNKCHYQHVDMSRHAVRSRVRRRARAWRRFFEHGELAGGMVAPPPVLVRNTFVHMEESEEESEIRPLARRSVSAGNLRSETVSAGISR
jgi:hypothetical protein